VRAQGSLLVGFALAAALAGCRAGPGGTGSGGDDEATWPGGRAAWSPIPGGEACGLYAADLARLRLPREVWASCGPGCLSATALNSPGDRGIHRASAAATYADGEIYLRLESGAPAYTLIQLTRLSTGQTLAAELQTSHFESCVLSGAAAHGAFVQPIHGGPGLFAGLYDPRAGKLTWPTAWLAGPLPIMTSVFALDGGWGAAFYDGTIRTVTAQAGPALTTIETTPVPSFSAVGAGDRVFWSSLDPARGLEVIKGQVPGRGVQVFVAQDGNAHQLAASATTLVWVGAHGPEARQGTYQAAELYWSPLPTVPGEVAITRGPALPVPGGLSALQTAGDHAALVTCQPPRDRAAEELRCQLLVVQLSTRRLWSVRSRPGSVFLDVLAVSPTEVVATEIDAPGRPALLQQVQRLVRLDLAHLDQLAAAW
jgi:hypothetical protein